MKLLTVMATLFFSATCLAQQDKDAVKSVIQTFFAGMQTQDTALIKHSLDSSCFLLSILQRKDGSTVKSEEATDQFLKQVAALKGQKLDERLLSYDIKTDGVMAIAWTPYRFYFNDTFSHCGVNVFTLIRRGSGWKIMGITDTRRKMDCDE